MKRFAKKIMRRFCLSVAVPLLNTTSKLNPETARQKLMALSAKPTGEILVKNDLQEPDCDLQIIIPAYNAEAYLEACMESVLSQKTQYSFKVVLIDDGSTDSTPQIADRYLDQENVIVIHQENRGFSGARNRGLETLFGKYIMFVDSDDMLCDGAIEALMSEAAAHDFDIVQGGAYSLKDGKLDICFSYPQKKPVSTAPGVLRSFPWAKVFKAECFENIVLPEGFWYEDSIFVFLLYPLKKHCCVLDDLVYIYRQNPAGITGTSKGKPKSVDSYWITEKIMETLCELDIPTDRVLFSRFIYQVTVNQRRMSALPQIVQECAFVLSSEMMHKYFASDLIDANSNNPVVQALQNKAWKKFRLCCKL